MKLGELGAAKYPRMHFVWNPKSSNGRWERLKLYTMYILCQICLFDTIYTYVTLKYLTDLSKHCLFAKLLQHFQRCLFLLVSRPRCPSSCLSSRKSRLVRAFHSQHVVFKPRADFHHSVKVKDDISHLDDFQLLLFALFVPEQVYLRSKLRWDFIILTDYSEFQLIWKYLIQEEIRAFWAGAETSWIWCWCCMWRSVRLLQKQSNYVFTIYSTLF